MNNLEKLQKICKQNRRDYWIMFVLTCIYFVYTLYWVLNRIMEELR